MKNILDYTGKLKDYFVAKNSIVSANQNNTNTIPASSVVYDLNSARVGEIADIEAYLGIHGAGDVLGLQVDFENKTFARLAGAVGRNAGNDFDQFNLFGGRRRCNLSDAGKVNAYYGDAAYKEDGSNGQVMVEQPAFYYRVQPLKLEKNTQSNIGYHLRKANYYVSDKPYPGFKLHPAFYDADGNPVSKIFISAYEVCLYDQSAGAYITNDAQVMDTSVDKLSSIANAKPASGLTQNFSKPNQETLAQRRGAKWHCDLIKAESANQLLMFIEYGTLNLQTALGRGVVDKTDDSSSNMANNTGATASLGNKSGQASGTNGQVSISYRGMENPYGNIWKHVNGINIWGDGTYGGGQPYVCNNFNFDESKNADNYEAVGFTVTNANGYISAMGYGTSEFDWLFMASECLGSDALPVGDYHWITANLNGYRVALLGGSWDDGSLAGLLYWALDGGVGYRYRYLGGRAVCV